VAIATSAFWPDSGCTLNLIWLFASGGPAALCLLRLMSASSCQVRVTNPIPYRFDRLEKGSSRRFPPQLPPQFTNLRDARCVVVFRDCNHGDCQCNRRARPQPQLVAARQGDPSHVHKGHRPGHLTTGGSTKEVSTGCFQPIPKAGCDVDIRQQRCRQSTARTFGIVNTDVASHRHSVGRKIRPLPRCEPGINGRQHKRREQGRRDQAADHDRGQRPLHFRAVAR